MSSEIKPGASPFQALNIPDSICDVLEGTKQYLKPTPIQEQAIRALSAIPPKHFIGQAPTGSGKTDAYLIHALMQIQPTLQKCQVIIVEPTPELVSQVTTEAKILSQRMEDLSIIGISRASEISSIKLDEEDEIPHQCLITVPSAANQIISTGYVDPSLLRTVILDEADELTLRTRSHSTYIEPFLDEVSSHPATQLVFFSATASNIPQDVVDRYLPGHISVKIADAGFEETDKMLDRIDQYCVYLDGDRERLAFINDLWRRFDFQQAFIFISNHEDGKLLQKQLKEYDIPAELLPLPQSDPTGQKRDAIIANFRELRFRILICADDLARGIDVPIVNLVINYSPPAGPDGLPLKDTYVHRIGRCARGDRRGVAITFADPDQEDYITEFENNLQHPIFELENFEPLKEYWGTTDAFDEAIKPPPKPTSSSATQLNSAATPFVPRMNTKQYAKGALGIAPSAGHTQVHHSAQPPQPSSGQLDEDLKRFLDNIDPDDEYDPYEDFDDDEYGAEEDDEPYY